MRELGFLLMRIKPDGWVKEDGDRRFSVVHSDRTRGNGHKPKYGKFHLNISKTLFALLVVKHWNRLPREVVASSLFKILKTQLGKVLSNLL